VYSSGASGTMPAGLSADALHTARETLAGATVVAGQSPGRVGEAVLHSAREAFVDGMHAVAIAAAILMTAVAVFSVVFLRRAEAGSPPPEGGTRPSPLEARVDA
jgi:DHA2 family multidrug resistance protein-like MFS transporter